MVPLPGSDEGQHLERLHVQPLRVVDGEGVPGGVSQRGAAPGTRETDLLDPLNLVDKVNAIVLSGGGIPGSGRTLGPLGLLVRAPIYGRVKGLRLSVPAATPDAAAPEAST